MLEILQSRGCRIKSAKYGKWRIVEPLGGIKSCNTFSELLDYVEYAKVNFESGHQAVKEPESVRTEDLAGRLESAGDDPQALLSLLAACGHQSKSSHYGKWKIKEPLG